MLREHTIGVESASVLGTPQAIREYIKRIGEDKFIVYGFPGFLVADSVDKETSERIAKTRFKNVSYIPKPIGTIYCTDGTNGATTITDGLDIAKLNLKVDKTDMKQYWELAIKEITGRKSYFIGEEITGMRKGAFTALANYYNNLLSFEELEKYKDLFDGVNDEIRLTNKGESVLDLFKETWDYTPRETRALCKLDIRLLISKLFGDLNEEIPLDLEYVKSQLHSENTPDILKGYIKDGIEKLKGIIWRGKDHSYIHERKGILYLNTLEYKLQYEDIINHKIDIGKICDEILSLAPEAIRPQAKRRSQVPDWALEEYYARKNWRDELESATNVLITYMSQIRLHNIDPRRQLELLEKGGFVRLSKLSYGDLAGHTMIYRGQNFKQINDVGGAFCPIGLSEKWDTWKIERLGRDITLTKYFRNHRGELLRVSANNYGGVKIEGSAEPVFDDATAKEINMVEELINYGLASAMRAPFKFKALEQDDEECAPGPSAPKIKKQEQKGPKTPKVWKASKAQEALLRKIKKF